MNTFVGAGWMVVVMVLAACGSSSDPDISFADSGPGADATPVIVCNPVNQQGCSAGEKCAPLTESLMPLLVRTTCVPNGTVEPNGVCEAGEPGPTTGYDNCAATEEKGYYCRGNVCSEVCSQSPTDTCGSEGNCVQIHNLFSDVEGVGVCAARCDAALQDCAAESQACYLQTGRGTMSCSRVPEEAEDRTQNMPCYGPQPGSCFLNGCAKGYGAILNDQPGTATGTVCAFFCNPSMETRTGDPAGIQTTYMGGDRPNGPGPAYECRYVNNFYSNTHEVPDHIGMAVDPEVWGSCNEHGLEGEVIRGCQPGPLTPSAGIPSSSLEFAGGKLVIPHDIIRVPGQ
jgi:hypothetical protein